MNGKEEIKKKAYMKLPAKNPFTWKNLGRTIHSLLDGTFLTRDRFMRAMPFILFLMLLGIIYISNIFNVERSKRQIDDMEEELRELRYEYVTSRSKLMFESKPSEIVTKLKDTGIDESMTPPKKIMVVRESNSK